MSEDQKPYDWKETFEVKEIQLVYIVLSLAGVRGVFSSEQAANDFSESLDDIACIVESWPVEANTFELTATVANSNAGEDLPEPKTSAEKREYWRKNQLEARKVD